jgi:hypothetical protein
VMNFDWLPFTPLWSLSPVLHFFSTAASPIIRFQIINPNVAKSYLIRPSPSPRSRSLPRIALTCPRAAREAKMCGRCDWWERLWDKLKDGCILHAIATAAISSSALSSPSSSSAALFGLHRHCCHFLVYSMVFYHDLINNIWYCWEELSQNSPRKAVDSCDGPNVQPFF